jgi:hypothetical protein
MAWDYGSQHQLRRWILERAEDVNQDLTDRNPALREWAQEIEWISPSPDSTKELRDTAWDIVGLAQPSPQQAGWWPAGGAVWDAVARVHGPKGEIGAILVEAKGRENELRAGGTKATATASIDKIKSALAEVQAGLGVGPNSAWLGSCYQPANRLAVLWFARVQAQPPVPVWLVSMYFLGESYPKGNDVEVGPPTEEAWEPIIEKLHAEMGLPQPPHALSDWWFESFLPALSPPPDA